MDSESINGQHGYSFLEVPHKTTKTEELARRYPRVDDAQSLYFSLVEQENEHKQDDWQLILL
eukprot:scaffold516_cov175-Amphora_coffeaeformis.AAC.3